MNSFAVALLLVLGVTTCGAKTTVAELQQALNTGDKIWTVQRNYTVTDNKGKHLCVYAHKTSLEEDGYRFEQGYKAGEGWHKADLIGKLSQSESGAVLTVKKPEGNKGRPYTLLYWNGTRHCGILQFYDEQDRNNKCELHVWASTLKTSGEDYPCLEEYDRHCHGGDKDHVYNPSCGV